MSTLELQEPVNATLFRKKKKKRIFADISKLRIFR